MASVWLLSAVLHRRKRKLCGRSRGSASALLLVVLTGLLGGAVQLRLGGDDPDFI